MPRPVTPALRSARTLLAVVLTASPLLLGASSRADAAQPNVVILLADDLGWADVGYHGGEIETPSIDRLAREGVRLERFYAAPICSPTRAALVTGRDPLKLGIAYDQLHPWYNAGLAPGGPTLPRLFQIDGYQTAIVGKWHLGHSYAHQLPNAQGFDHFWGHLHTNTDFYTHAREGGHDLQVNGKSLRADGQYLTHLEANEAVRFVRERDPRKPFLLYVPFTAPHSPMQAPPGTIEKYASLPRRNFRRTYAAMVDEMDQAIGRILTTLDEEGLAEDTIVLFLSDNGGSDVFGGRNLPLRGFKGQTFEGGIRVPAVIRWPARLDAGRVIDDMVTVMDVLPTLARAANVRVPTTAELDGVSFWPALARDQPVARSKPVGFVSEIPIPGRIHTALFEGRWKLVQVIEERQTETRVQQLLFDIEADPNEQDDLSGRHTAIVTRMARLMETWRRQHPLGGTRGTLVAHPGWVAPKDWADAALPAALMQPAWQNELPFSKELFDATAHRGVLTDEKTRRRLIRESEARRAAQAAESEADVGAGDAGR